MITKDKDQDQPNVRVAQHKFLAEGMQSTHAQSSWNQGMSPSKHIDVFTSQECPLSLRDQGFSGVFSSSYPPPGVGDGTESSSPPITSLT